MCFYEMLHRGNAQDLFEKRSRNPQKLYEIYIILFSYVFYRGKCDCASMECCIGGTFRTFLKKGPETPKNL